MNLLHEHLSKPYHFVKDIYRNLKLFINKTFFKLDKNYLRKKFLEIGLKNGMNVYVHSSLSSFGYVENGAESVLTVLKDIIEDGTIMMPTFTQVKKEFSLNDPCWTGKISETFRLESKRSIHPSHSITAKGKYADYLIKDHEKSKMPFDEHSPFAKFSRLDSYILMLGTENNSMIHYVQNNVKFPDLFLKGNYEFKFNSKKIKTKLHDPKGSITYIYNGKPCTDVYFLVNMYKDLKFENRIMKTVKIGNAICHLIKTKEFVDEATKYLKENIARYKNECSLRLKNGIC
jgi:aminoglycoside 3-N-acetyltransferase